MGIFVNDKKTQEAARQHVMNVIKDVVIEAVEDKFKDVESRLKVLEKKVL